MSFGKGHVGENQEAFDELFSCLLAVVSRGGTSRFESVKTQPGDTEILGPDRESSQCQ